MYLFVSLFVNPHFLSYYFSALNIFQGFSLYFARTLECAVDKLWNGSRVLNSHGQFIFGKQSLSLSGAPNVNFRKISVQKTI